MKILVVDDSKAVRKIVRNMLNNVSCEVFEAEDGEKALDLIYEHGYFDLILLDWNMPKIDGYEFLRTVKENPDWKGIKIIMITSKNDQESVIEALKAGADEYLMKPFDQKMLLTKIEMVMEAK